MLDTEGVDVGLNVALGRGGADLVGQEQGQGTDRRSVTDPAASSRADASSSVRTEAFTAARSVALTLTSASAAGCLLTFEGRADEHDHISPRHHDTAVAATEIESGRLRRAVARGPRAASRAPPTASHRATPGPKR